MTPITQTNSTFNKTIQNTGILKKEQNITDNTADNYLSPAVGGVME